MTIKRFSLMLIALLLMSMLLLSACAAPAEEAQAADEPKAPVETEQPEADYFIDSLELAEETARAEITKMQELGLLSEKLYISATEPNRIELVENEDDFARTDSPYYRVHWYADSFYLNNWEGENRYSVCVHVNANTGKLSFINIEAAADEGAPVVKEKPVKQTYYNAETGEDEVREEVWLYHENFDDLFPGDMTVNRFCELLNEYWGFEGYSIGSGGELAEDVLLRDVSGGTTANYCVTVYFEGDEEGRAMYIQLAEFPGRVCLLAGTDHLKG